MLATDRLFLVRHGESTYNAEGRLQGQADPPLSPLGRAEAEALARSLDGLSAQAVVSDLVRARETAALLGHPDAPTDRRLREIDVGEWEGRMLAEFPAGPEFSWRGGPVVPPGGEAWEELVARVGGAVDELLDAGGGPWLVIAHGGVVRAAVTHLTGADARQLAGPANASVTVLEGRRLRAYAWTPQLSVA
jgi:broad specificity phosphatase PhoE